MPNLLAMSFEGEFAPSFDLTCLTQHTRLPDGWGIGFYPGGDPSASVLKEPAPVAGSIRSELVKAWEHLASSIFLVHIRAATWGANNDANTQPFVRSYGRRDWMMAHAGSLTQRPDLGVAPRFEPVGSTDTEYIFCDILSRLAAAGWKSLAEADAGTLRSWFESIEDDGELNVVLSDGRDLCVYSDHDGDGGFYLWQVLPPYEKLAFGDDDLAVDLTKRGAKSRKGLIISSSPLKNFGGPEPVMRRMEPGEMLLIRQGEIVSRQLPLNGASEQAVSDPALPRAKRLNRPELAPERTYDIVHRTVYRYRAPVERSEHLFRLQPIDDRLQKLQSFRLSLSVEGQVRDYDDVFGNAARWMLLEKPYSELAIEARSRVTLCDTDPLNYHPVRERSTIPLVWMPWQRQILQPFLLPQELPESELSELSEYAMSFVTRNDFDLLDTLLDMNLTIFREYKYAQGTTNLHTTPFDVYVNRRGVCQDFANLFICLCRLLSIPARYVCGYIYTGPKNPNQRQSEASHAWVQVYLPRVGWKGFDPTNGILTQTEHIRVASGRNWLDATPTSGTLYVGGSGETLSVDVQVIPVGEG